MSYPGVPMNNTQSTKDSHTTHPTSYRHHSVGSRRWRWVKRLLTIAFFIAVPTLLFMLIKNVDWQEVFTALRNYPATTLLKGAAVALTSYCVFSGYDLIGRRYTGHQLATRHIIPLAFVCYAFTLNLTAWVGGVALRFRLYSRLGLGPETITKIMSLSLITNWLGYIILAGTLFSFRQVDLPEKFTIGVTALQAIGFVLLAIAASYFAACRFSKRRSFRLRGHKVTLPNIQIALSQAGLAMTNWMLMGLLIFTLMPEGVSYPTILGILLISSIAGVIAHIPAGLGVMEAVFVAMLHHQFSQGTVLAAIIGYRLLYFLAPLAIACVIYLVLEAKAKRIARTQSPT